MTKNNESTELAELIAGMTDEQKRAFIEKYQSYRKRRDEYPLAFVRPTAPQADFLRLPQIVTAMYGANSSGKSFIGAYKAACYLVGEDPLGLIPYEIPKPNRQFAGVNRTTKLWMGCTRVDKGMAIMRQNLAPLLPPDSFEISDYKQLLVMKKTGASIQAISYDAKIESWQSDAVDGIWLDEQAPYDVYRESFARVARVDGRIWLTLTFLYEHSLWQYWEIFKKGNSAAAPHIGYVIANLDSNTYLSSDQISNLKTFYANDPDATSRIDGYPTVPAGLVHKAFDQTIHVIEPFEITKYYKDRYKFARIFDLHPRQNSVGTLAMYQESPLQIYIIGELSLPGGISNIPEFKYHVHKYLEEFETDGIPLPIDTTILDAPETALTKTGSIYAANHQDQQPYGLLSSLAADEQYKLDNTVRRVPGITGIPGNRDLTTAISRFNTVLGLRDPQAFFIFSTCKNHIHSIESLAWDNYKSQDYDRPLRERVTTKDDHEVRNIHYLTMHLPHPVLLAPDDDIEQKARRRSRPKHNTPNFSRRY